MRNNYSRLADLPFEQKEKLHEALSELIEKVTGENDAKNLRVEKSLARYVISAWNPRADKAVKAGVNVAANASPKAKFTETQKNKVLSACAKAFAGIDKEVSSRVLKDVRVAYANTKKAFKGKLKVKKGKLYYVTKHSVLDDDGMPCVHEQLIKSWAGKRIEKATIQGVNFSIEDEETTKQLGRLISGSIGDHFDRQKKPIITEVIEEAMMDEGMTNEEAAEFLQSELSRRLGGTEAALSAVPESVASLGQNSINAYFEGLIATNMNWAQNFARVNAMREAEITRYRLAVVVDNATSDICLDLVGREFELKHAIDYMDNILEADSADDIKEFAPWRDSISDVGVSGDTPNAEEVLAANGMAMPPYHGHCRTEVEPA